ncbi:Uma2 family endonuclease [Streptomyces sp. NBC_01197]|uniref:Uma2 family endonuclease n=1 Tax=Streptomyces sp. NBC_01197 TaxID=2903768 RepID=UPI002E0DADCA|nr:Uma2 family endonuclease [Streptomyces sp. NBC_01197]
MTPSTADHAQDAQMSVEEFEELARHAPETVSLEFISGKLAVKHVLDQLHGAIVMWLLRQCMQHRPELALYPEQGLKVDSYRRGRACADGALAPLDHYVGQSGEWADPDGTLMVVEVTSYDADTDLRDRVEKRDGYAAAGIPVYLLVDRDAEKLVVYSEPDRGEYRTRTSHAYGSTVTLPSPVSITLETGRLKDYAG